MAELVIRFKDIRIVDPKDEKDFIPLNKITALELAEDILVFVASLEKVIVEFDSEVTYEEDTLVVEVT